MPRARKTHMQRIMRPAHLYGIGLVAAQWSSLEMALLSIMGSVAAADFVTVVTMAGPANVTGIFPRFS